MSVSILNPLRWAVLLAVMGALLLAGCGKADGPGGVQPTVTPTTITHGSERSDVLIRIERTGGFAPIANMLSQYPDFILFGDGCAVASGPVIAIYPGQLMPNLLETCYTEEAVQLMLHDAKTAGLLDGDANYPRDGIADAMTTVVTVTADGKTSMVSAYALEIGGETDAGEHAEARRKLSEFVANMSSSEVEQPAENRIGETHPYTIERLQIVAAEVSEDTVPPDGITPEERAWPLDENLGETGAPIQQDTLRCIVYESETLAKLLPELNTANTLTRWESHAKQYTLTVRPLYPGDTGCEMANPWIAGTLLAGRRQQILRLGDVGSG